METTVETRFEFIPKGNPLREGGCENRRCHNLIATWWDNVRGGKLCEPCKLIMERAWS